MTAVRWCGLILLAFLAWLPVTAEPPEKPVEIRSPLTPQEEQKHFQLAPGLRIELAACEPQIESPVALAFDEHGKLWVVEMRDYPNGPAKGEKPAGRIRVLEDKDGDGFYEHSTIFADHLLFANGVLPWKDGVLVTAAPHIVYLKDTDGDGKADHKEVLWQGFAAQNPQLRVSHPTLGVDGWVYVANGLRGGQAINPNQKDAKPINLSGRDFRFDPFTGQGEAITGMGQYGNTFDDWGQRFVCDNRHHLRHVVIATRYVERNPHLAVTALVQDTSELELGQAGAGGKIFPLSKNWTTSNLHAGRFTAACGVHIYRGSLLPNYYGCAFTCDPTGNLVHVEKLQPHGATFHSQPLFEQKEFLASPEDWFRPVFLATGPEGALYVVDMYRAVIEHPEFMPPELQKRPDLTLGKDRGRIWRIVPAKHQTQGFRPTVTRLTTKELILALDHPEPWFRSTAQRLLLERWRKDDSADQALRASARESASAAGRLHAAWLLHRQGKLDNDLLLALLRADHARLREQAVVLAEERLTGSAKVQAAVLALANDPDARVRFQVACSLGDWEDDRILPALAQIVIQGAGDKWTRLAVAGSVATRSGKLLGLLLSENSELLKGTKTDRLMLVQELAAVVGSRRDAREVAGLLETLGQMPDSGRQRWQTAALLGLTKGMGRRGTRFTDFLAQLSDTEKASATVAEKLLARSAQLAADPKLALEERLDAVGLLSHLPEKLARPVLVRLLREDPQPALRQAAIRSLAAFTSADVAELLLQGWASYTPALRQEVAEALLRQPARIEVLLRELEGGKVKARELDPVSRRRLLAYPNPDIRQRAARLLASAVPEARKQVIARYRAALEMKGDAKKGLEVFKQHCATCHRMAGVGHIAGPDISDTRTKTLEQLLIDILDPNAAIDANYLNYQVVTKDGRVFTGLIAAETAAGLTLRRGDNQQDIILRQDIDEIRSTGQSLMPDGLEQNITIAQMADLLSFLKNWRYLDGSVPGIGGQ